MKRSKFLVNFSREHHHGLLHVWLLRRGLRNKIALEKMIRYADWFFRTSLAPHFAEEESKLVPLIGENHPYRERLIREHGRLTELMQLLKTKPDEISLTEYLNLIESHIRFEERELFRFLQTQYPEK